jgi:hypothetical protein
MQAAQVLMAAVEYENALVIPRQASAKAKGRRVHGFFAAEGEEGEAPASEASGPAPTPMPPPPAKSAWHGQTIAEVLRRDAPNSRGAWSSLILEYLQRCVELAKLPFNNS